MKDWTDLEKCERLEWSIICAIRKYRSYQGGPSCILVNDVAGRMLQALHIARWGLVLKEEEVVYPYICGLPVRIGRGWELEDKPRFWLCEEGEVLG